MMFSAVILIWCKMTFLPCLLELRKGFYLLACFQGEGHCFACINYVHLPSIIINFA